MKYIVAIIITMFLLIQAAPDARAACQAWPHLLPSPPDCGGSRPPHVFLPFIAEAE